MRNTAIAINAYILAINPASKFPQLLNTLGGLKLDWFITQGLTPISVCLKDYESARRRHSAYFGVDITVPEYCCVYGHYKIWQSILETGVRSIVLEEDAIVADPVGLMALIHAWATNNVDDILYLGGMEGCEYRKRDIFVRKDSVSLAIGAYGVINKYGSPNLLRTVGYALSPRAAKSLIGLYNKIPFVADRWDYILHSIKGLNIYYSEVIQHPIIFKSSVQNGPPKKNLECTKSFPSLPLKIKGILARKLFLPISPAHRRLSQR